MSRSALGADAREESDASADSAGSDYRRVTPFQPSATKAAYADLFRRIEATRREVHPRDGHQIRYRNALVSARRLVQKSGLFVRPWIGRNLIYRTLFRILATAGD